jgi:hypothetical protein
MNAGVDIAASLAAHEKVNQAIAHLRDQLRANAREIGQTEAAISHLQNGYPPFEDLKVAIIEHALSWSDSEANREIVEGLRQLGGKESHGSHRKPMRYRDVLKDLPANGTPSPDNINALHKVLFSEHALYFYCRDLVRLKLTGLLNGLHSNVFGYDNIDTAQIGPNWKERQSRLADLQQKLDELQIQKNGITEHLINLGVPRNNIWGN